MGGRAARLGTRTDPRLEQLLVEWLFLFPDLFSSDMARHRPLVRYHGSLQAPTRQSAIRHNQIPSLARATKAIWSWLTLVPTILP